MFHEPVPAHLEEPKTLYNDPVWDALHTKGIEMVWQALPYRPDTSWEEDNETAHWIAHALYVGVMEEMVWQVMKHLRHNLRPLQILVRNSDRTTH